MPPKRKAQSAPKKTKKVNGYLMAPEIPAGHIFQDSKVQWMVGKPIGTGGFGWIYLADKAEAKTVKNTAEYVIKVEPVENGPLFCELAFYKRILKSEMIKEWTEEHKLDWLGIPDYISCGFHTYNDTKLRFMIMERFDSDLQKAFENFNKSFSYETVLLVALRMLDALEYIHHNNYVHADIKASNILTGFSKSDKDKIFLVDYGLVHKYVDGNGNHKEYKEDKEYPRKAHDEFTSIDAHKGVQSSRRSDLEILGYCMVQWLCGSLPWENNLENKDYVRDEKIKYMKNIPAFLKKCFPEGLKLNSLKLFLEYVQKMKYEQKPDYNKLRKLFRDNLKELGIKDSGKVFIRKAQTTPNKKRPAENDNIGESPKKKSKAAKKSPIKKTEGVKKSPIKKTKGVKKSPLKKTKISKKAQDSPKNGEENIPPKIAKGSPIKSAVKKTPPEGKMTPQMLAVIKSRNAKADNAKKMTAKKLMKTVATAATQTYLV